jgi:hypothetical protein
VGLFLAASASLAKFERVCSAVLARDGLRYRYRALLLLPVRDATGTRRTEGLRLQCTTRKLGDARSNPLLCYCKPASYAAAVAALLKPQGCSLIGSRGPHQPWIGACARACVSVRAPGFLCTTATKHLSHVSSAIAHHAFNRPSNAATILQAQSRQR